MVDRPTPMTPPDLVEVLTLHGLAVARIEQRAIRLRSLRASDAISHREFRGEMHRLVKTVRDANELLVTGLLKAPELEA
jgi:hypothetical protein